MSNIHYCNTLGQSLPDTVSSHTTLSLPDDNIRSRPVINLTSK